jgi:ATP phosphoribosyltransferase
MRSESGRLNIAIQNNGRLTGETFTLLRSCGLDFDSEGKSLRRPCRNFDLDILALRDDDIPEYVQNGVADLGIIGMNLVVEKEARVKTLARLGFGNCRLEICVPEHSAIGCVDDLRGKRIATSYPSTLAGFLRSEEMECGIVYVSGTVELAPSLDVADAICDIVSTGSTARMNGLRPLHTVLESESVLIANHRALADGRKSDLIDRLMIRIRGSIEARGRRYMMLNAPRAALENITAIIPSLRSPTVVPLADENMVAVHSVIAEDVFWDVMENLKRAVASDIIVIPIETIIG